MNDTKKWHLVVDPIWLNATPVEYQDVLLGEHPVKLIWIMVGYKLTQPIWLQARDRTLDQVAHEQ